MKHDWVKCPYSVRWEDSEGVHLREFTTYDEAVRFENETVLIYSPRWSELRQPGQMRRWERG
jgi:hypothetical protein